jgi:hypothetical protein
MEPVPFTFLSDDEFFSLSQAEKASYLITAVRELSKMTAQLGTLEQQLSPPPLQSLPSSKLAH